MRYSKSHHHHHTYSPFSLRKPSGSLIRGEWIIIQPADWCLFTVRDACTCWSSGESTQDFLTVNRLTFSCGPTSTLSARISCWNFLCWCHIPPYRSRLESGINIEIYKRCKIWQDLEANIGLWYHLLMILSLPHFTDNVIEWSCQNQLEDHILHYVLLPSFTSSVQYN